MNEILVSIGTGLTIGLSIYSAVRLARDGQFAKVSGLSNVVFLVPASIALVLGFFA